MSSKSEEIQEALLGVTQSLQEADSANGEVGQLVTDIIELANQMGTESSIESAQAIGEQADELNVLIQQAINKVLDVNAAVENFKAGN